METAIFRIETKGDELQIPAARDSETQTIVSHFQTRRSMEHIPYGGKYFRQLPFVDPARIRDHLIETDAGNLFAGCSKDQFEAAIKALGFKASDSDWTLSYGDRTFVARYEDIPGDGGWNISENVDGATKRIIMC